MANIITKIKLSDNSVYTLFDKDALRLSADNKLLTNNTAVNQIILDNNLYITEIDGAEVDSYNNILVTDAATGKVKYVSKDRLLADIGGVSSFALDDAGVLSLVIGKNATTETT